MSRALCLHKQSPCVHRQPRWPDVLMHKRLVDKLSGIANQDRGSNRDQQRERIYRASPSGVAKSCEGFGGGEGGEWRGALRSTKQGVWSLASQSFGDFGVFFSFQVQILRSTSYRLYSSLRFALALNKTR